MGHILFFATKNDLLPVLEAIEREIALKYTYTRTIATESPETFLFAREIPKLGIASHESSIANDTFLIGFKDAKIHPRTLSVFEGKPRFAFDQLYNPETVTLTAGGWWQDNILLYGRIATASKHSFSSDLMKRYAKVFRKQYVKNKVYYVGPEAQVALAAGKRLTIAAQSPPEFNLSLP